MLSNKAIYAIKAVLMLSEKYEDKNPVLIYDISKKEKIPRKFLESILLQLKNKGLLQSKKGKGGGYYLARRPESMTLGSVLRIFDNSTFFLPCLEKNEKCDGCADLNSCGVRVAMKGIQEATEKILNGVSIKDISDKLKKTKKEPMYYI